MATRYILIITILQLVIVACSAVSGVIWCKEKQEFIQLFNIPQFAALHEEALAKHHEMETHDMKNEVIKAVFYEEKNMAMFINNNTKFTGICGDMWYLLADYLNFTFIPVKIPHRMLGQKLENGTSFDMIDMLERNEVQVILRIGFFSTHLEYMDFTMPIWKTKFHIYTRSIMQYDNKWVFTLFSPKMWFSIIFLFIIVSLVGYFLQKIPKDYKMKRRRNSSVDFKLGDHFFYSFAMMCSQGYIPDDFHNKFKILSFSKSIFAWLVILAFNSNLIYHMTNRKTTLPFTDLETLFNNTEYTLLAFRGSFFYTFIQNKYENNKNMLARIHFIENPEIMYNKICDNLEKYAMFEIEDRYMASSRYGCPLHPTGNYNATWISFALKKNFRYRKTINAALIKFNEVGLTDSLRDRWLNYRLETKETKQFKMIDLYQVHLIFLILCYGALISLIILILEIIVHYHETNSTYRRSK